MTGLIKTIVVAGGLALALLAGGCVLAPAERSAEQERVDRAGKVYQSPPTSRPVEPLPANATWKQVLRRALLCNGELESSYFDWQAAMARVQQAGAYPNVDLQLGFEYMFSSQSMSAWDRTTLSAELDGLEFPTKTARRGKIALEEARAAGDRFAAKRFEIQRRVISGYLDWALLAQRLRIGRENLELLRLLTQTAANRLQAGGQQQDLLKAQIQQRLAENELQNLESLEPQLRSTLNAAMGRPATAELALPDQLPDARILSADDATLIAMAATGNPELSALARQVEGRKDALELARMAYIPNINPMAALTGDMSRMLGAMVMVPTNFVGIEGAIKEARAMLRGTEAIAHQAGLDKSAQFVAALFAMRNNQRQVELLEHRILPAARQVLDSSRQAYAAGSVPFTELIDSQRTLLEVKLMLVEAKASREQRLAEMEELAGVDVERMGVNEKPEQQVQP
ncbi:MAG: TolC family protein [Phycisphaerales bacterium]|nr:TolC family protein [Phycisphaerales bacterium]